MKEFLQYTLISFGDYDITILSVLKFIAFFVVIFFLLQIIKKTIFKLSRIELGKKYAIYNLTKYFIMVLACVIGIQILGFNLSILLAGSAALLVAIGLGLQSLFSDFVSGIILLVDSSVKVNDILDINGLVCKVKEINLRTTTVLTRDDKYIILPNTDLTRNHLINWTHSHISARFEVKVGVDYRSDVKLVMRLLKEATDQQSGVINEPVPFVRFTDYGDSALHFSVFFWSEEVFRVENIMSNIRARIFELFRMNDITIPFPQRVLHMAHPTYGEKTNDNIQYPFDQNRPGGKDNDATQEESKISPQAYGASATE